MGCRQFKLSFDQALGNHPDKTAGYQKRLNSQMLKGGNGPRGIIRMKWREKQVAGHGGSNRNWAVSASLISPTI
jgi:hypothetical protein